jgi:cytochrome-b5 reductase
MVLHGFPMNLAPFKMMSKAHLLPRYLTAKSASAFVVLGLGAYCTRSYILPTGHAESNEPPKVFSGFGFTTLRLQSAKDVNHNTKRLVFEFPDQNAKSGLMLTCMSTDTGCKVLNLIC